MTKEISKFQCPHCEKSYTKVAKLNKHVFIHHTEKNGLCLKCGVKHDGSYGIGAYCSINCAKSRTFTEATKKKTSKSLFKFYNKEEFSEEWLVKKLSNVHDNRYSYPNLTFKTADEKITVHCEKHGPFDQIYFHHLSGCGCPSCADEARKWRTRKTYKDKQTILYFIKMHSGDSIGFKIGLTLKSVKSRYSQDVSLNGISYNILYEWTFKDGAIAHDIEQAIIKKHSEIVFEREKAFLIGGNTELFTENIFPGSINLYEYLNTTYGDTQTQESLRALRSVPS